MIVKVSIVHDKARLAERPGDHPARHSSEFGREPIQDLPGTVTRAVADALADDTVTQVTIKRDFGATD